MILIDANVPMYLVDTEHPNKIAAMRLLERAVNARERLVTDAEVFQEMLHRYVAIDRRDALEPTFALLRGLVDEVFPITAAVVERAKAVVLGYRSLSARDAIHVASMQEHQVTRIMSFDRGFDLVSHITRVHA